MKSPLRTGNRVIRAAAACAVLFVATACGKDEPGETLCVPGQNVFCRCATGESSTQPCNSDGQSLGTCGPCDGDVADPTGGGTTDPPPTHEDPTGEGTRPFGAACTAAEDCASGACRFGYCTRSCDKPSDCPFPAAECVSDEDSAACMMACATDADCGTFDGAACQETSAVDHWAVRVCR